MSRCPLMYKDHYHCTATEGCHVTFKSKEGVREHAKQHELLDQSSEHYRQVSAQQSCPHANCPHSKTQKHFHCLWPNCSEVIASSEPVFRRLEHFKVHEFAAQTAGSKLSVFPSSAPADNGAASPVAQLPEIRRKRGRPPKYQVRSPILLGSI